MVIQNAGLQFPSSLGATWGAKQANNSVKGLHVKNPATRNRTRDHLISATLYSQMLYQLSYSRLCLLFIAQ